MAMVGEGLTLVGTYRRDLGASLERMLENAVDWEHLPYLHASTFSSIVCHDAGPWGFRARVGQTAGGEIDLELLLDRDAARWVSRVDGGTEVWTTATATGERSCRVDVSFHVAGVPAAAAAKVGAAYAAAYRRLYDEDESMMVGRQQVLDGACTGLRCPHLGGPLDPASAGADGVVQCPWHGYRFSLATGECVSGQRYRLRV